MSRNVAVIMLCLSAVIFAIAWGMARSDADFWRGQADMHTRELQEWQGINDTWKRVDQNNQAAIANYKQALATCEGQ